MRANQCDRCGQLYKNKTKKRFRLIRYSDCESRYQRGMDLCPDCEDDLEKWFNKMVIRGGTKHD